MDERSLIFSYLDLRRTVGMIGISLPAVLAIGSRLMGAPGLEQTLSAYYYTAMGDVFVGALFAVAVFLMSYRGWSKTDELVGDLAGMGAIGVALFPVLANSPNTQEPSTQEIICNFLHGGFATLFFASLAYFCLVLFRKTNPDQPSTPQKKQRNLVYLICGVVIVLCVTVIGLQYVVFQSEYLRQHSFVFWLESIAIVAFGVSWFVKGEGLLKDVEDN